MPKVRLIDFRVVVLAASLPLVGCSAIQLRPGTGALDGQPPGGVLVSVENHHVLDVRIYVVRGTTLIPLGTVGTLERRTFALPSGLAGGFGTLRLAADPVGSAEMHGSPEIAADVGDHVEWRLEANLRMSRFDVRRAAGGWASPYRPTRSGSASAGSTRHHHCVGSGRWRGHTSSSVAAS